MTIQLGDIPTSGLKAFIAELARQAGIGYVRDGYSVVAQAVTRLSGDDVCPDETEQFLIALLRAEVIDGATMVTLLGRYLDEINKPRIAG